ncbi:polyketide synthase [Truncatella angustata]|uniref:Polyketide synthase n=1 Tax=Truncatella angustata TaxID=152316 RepID=A0A9P8UFC7_9PEZI|nr:polyketide synthase [Truncatella angustata]KAH6648947.1 polyketide synthase [Truncatella angustata]KAH8198608.1 hypothetical protein TruAng_007240 [Truncatella angustata]
MSSPIDRGDPNAIAIVGMSCRFSGIASSPEGLWQMLTNGLTGWTNTADNRFNLNAFWHPQASLSGSFNARGLHLIKQDPALFDNGFFGISNIEAKAMDPQHRMMLEVAYEAFEDAGIAMTALKDSDTAVYCAVSHHDYEKILGRDAEVSPGYRFTGTGPSMLANRISYFFNLHGPSITLDTACSSGLVALHEACKSIRGGEVTQALVGGANLIIDPDQVDLISSLSFLSPHGRCYSFDSRAEGFGRGEGIAAVMLKSLDKALRDGDTIRAVIRGSSVVQDGRTSSITVPSGEIQARMMQRLYEQVGLDPSDTAYVEAHGTGTTLGDKIEASALRDTFCKNRDKSNLIVGSIKSNIGHTESVAGLAGLIKTVLILEKGYIPPNPTFVQPSEKLPIKDWNIEVPKCMIPWPENEIRRVSINSFGYGGTNGHAILEAAADYLGQSPARVQDNLDSSSRPRLFVLSHELESGIRETAANLKRFVTSLDETSQSLDSLAFSLNRRSVLNYRSFVTASTKKELLDSLASQATGEDRATSRPKPPKICFAFTGQGAQWAGMGRDLLDTNPFFAESMKRSQQILNVIGADWHLIEEISKDEHSRINEAAFSQPICTAIQIALVDLLASWNIHPVGVIGHSSGEIAAAYAAGMLSAEDALKIAYHRGRCVEVLKERYPDLRGAMLAAGISAANAQTYLLDQPINEKAVVACENSPSSVTISGDEKAVLAVQERLNEKKLFHRRLIVETAYHSHHMDLIRDDYMDSIKDINCTARRSSVQMVSSVNGEEVQDGVLGVDYWCNNLTSPVRFVDAVAGILEVIRSENKEPVAMVELGPHAALSGPIKQTIKAKSIQGVDYLSVLHRFQDGSKTALTAAGQLFQSGYLGLDLNVINNPYGTTDNRHLSDMPRYSWNHKTTHWSESRRSANYRSRKFPRHDLLGSFGLDSISDEPIWRNHLNLQRQPWLAGHAIGGLIIFPAAGYLAMVAEALKQVALSDGNPWKNLRLKFRNVNFGSALIISDTSTVETILALRSRTHGSSWREFHIFSVLNNGQSTEHCRGMVTTTSQGRQRDLTDETSTALVDQVKRENMIQIDPRNLYQELRTIGLQYTGVFAGQQQIRASKHGSVCRIPVPDVQSIMPAKYQQPHCIHPSTLDLCFQSVFPIMKTAGLLGSSTSVSFINSLDIHTDIPSKPGQELEVITNLRQYGNSKVIADTVVTHSRGGKSSMFMRVNGLVLASSGGFLHSGPSQRPEGESLTHQLKWSIDPDLAQSGAVVAHCQLGQTELMAQGNNHVCSEYAKHLIQKTLGSLSPHDEIKIEGHLLKFFQWLKSRNTTQNFESLSSSTTDIEEQVKRAGPIGEMLAHIGPHLAEILRGEVDALSLLQEDNHLEKLYSHGSYDRCNRQLAKYVQLLQFKNPNMRILEIDPGTANTTTPIIEALSTQVDCLGRPKFDKYTFADISTGSLEVAEQRREKFGGFIEFKKLDLDKQPIEQGFDLGSYDLVIATNAAHATRDIERSLNNVRALLKENGHLVLIEHTVPTLHTGLIFGMLPGWWLAADGRQEGPLHGISKWDECLRACGFSGTDINLPDYGNAEHEMNVLITSACQEPTPLCLGTKDLSQSLTNSPSYVKSPSTQSVTSDIASPRSATDSGPSTEDIYDDQIVQIVHGAAEESLAQHLSEIFRAEGIPAATVELKDLLPSDRLVVVLLESMEPFLATCADEDWQKVRQICSYAAGVLWITTGAAIETPKPMGALITGLSRTLRSENRSAKFVTADLEENSSAENRYEWDCRAAVNIFNIFRRSLYDYNPESMIEWEYAVRDGQILIPRVVEELQMNDYVRDSVSKFHPRLQSSLESGRALGLKIRVPGLLDTLYWADSEKHSRPVGPEEVRVELEFISLNFKDIMIAMGQLDGHSELLLEGSGKVVQVGDSLSSQFVIGDSVYVCDFDGLATTSNVHKSRVLRVPQNMGLDIPAATGIAYATAFYALVDRANLQAGETVLIHSGAGAVGQAAITLAQNVCKAGKIFVTVGSAEKREFIKNTFGIPDEHIFSSRGLDFYEGALRQTKGEGVDVLLNSLSGEALQKGVDLLAPLGRFVEIGKKDLLSFESRLEMRSLEKNTQFSTVDLTMLGRKRPDQLHGILDTVFSLLAQSQITTFGPIEARPLSKLEEVFRLMQSGQHMGKLLLKTNPVEPILVQPPKPAAVKLKSNFSYLVIGGTGGLGKQTLRLLANLGAKKLITISRSGLDGQTTKDMVEELSGRGVEVTVHKGSVLDKTFLESLKDRCRDHPIKGVIQGAMVLEDSRVEGMGYTQWRAAMEPKVFGTWNIHEVFGDSLDFFVLLSSIGGVIGSLGQGNYGAGNTFQDAVARYRAVLRLPGRSINVGLVEDAGYTAENEAAAEFMKRQGLTTYRLGEFLATIEEAIKNPVAATPNEAQLLCGLSRADPSSQDEAGILQRPDPKFSYIWRKSRGQERRDPSSTQVDVQAVLRCCGSAEEAVETTLTAIKTKLARLLAVLVDDIRVDRTLASHGVDSLIAIELRNWISTFLEAHVDSLELMSSIPFADLVALIAKRSCLVPPGIFAK